MAPQADHTPLRAVEQGLSEEEFSLEASSPVATKPSCRLAPKISGLLVVAALVAYVASTQWSRGGGRKVDTANLVKMSELPPPFMLDALPDGKCQGDSFVDKGGELCIAPWVYCTDANCDSNLKEKNGVLVAECDCWMPKTIVDNPIENTSASPNLSIIPKTTSGAGCVYNAVKEGSYPFSAIGGSGMCEEMKKGKLISTYGPLGWAPPALAVKCAAKTQWAWCWGAPCEEIDGKIICDCPIVVSNYDTPQYVSVQTATCAKEEGCPCDYIHNGSPAGESPMKNMKQCSVADCE